jgi:hypothetical protein
MTIALARVRRASRRILLVVFALAGLLGAAIITGPVASAPSEAPGLYAQVFPVDVGGR